jgi:hypothetical protein
MATAVEIASGAQYQFSADEGQVAASLTRSFRILKSDASEYVNISAACGISVGQVHPVEADLYCHSYSAQYDGDSRMVIQATFNYKSTSGTAGQAASNPSQDRNQTPPDLRPANWSVSTSLQEVPAYSWIPVTGPNIGQIVPTVNSAQDLYEGITRLEPIITISVEQFEASDPTRLSTYAGFVNSLPFRIGTLNIFERSLMLRGVRAQPTTERWGETTYRGWKASYELDYRANYYGPLDQNIGWDQMVPQVGNNVIMFAPPGNATQDPFGQPLDWNDGGIVQPLALPRGVNAGDKLPAAVRITSRDENGRALIVQNRAGLPIPLNDDGTARRRTAAGGPVIVHRYQVQNAIDFALLGIRLE